MKKVIIIEEENHTNNKKFKRLINNNIISWLLYMLGYAIVLISVSLMFRKNKSAVTTIVIIGILLIPLSVSALCKCQIELRSIVSIKKPIYNGTITRSSSTDLKIGDTIEFSNDILHLLPLVFL